MKKVIVGALVGAIILFVFQALMWMGGFNKHFYTYTANQDTIMAVLKANLTDEGLYQMPMADSKSPDFKVKQKEIETQMIGSPWAMVFYHPGMEGFSVVRFLLGLVHTFIAALFAALVLYYGMFAGFRGRFIVSMAFGLFALVVGPLSDMTWWYFPWSFIRPKILEMVIGWGLVSVWLGWFVKGKREIKAE